MSVAQGPLEHLEQEEVQHHQWVAEFHCSDCQGEEGPGLLQVLVHQRRQAPVSQSLPWQSEVVEAGAGLASDKP